MTYIHNMVLPNYTHDDSSRNLFANDLSLHINNKIYAKCYKNFYNDLPKKISTKYQLSQTRNFLLKKTPYKFWSSLKRNNQEVLFDNVGSVIHQQINKFSFKKFNKNLKYGTIKLSKKICTPKYLTSVDIHCMPGGYTHKSSSDDISVGALYDSSLYQYSRNSLGKYNDDMGNSVCLWLKNNFKTFIPDKILDMGCGIGNNSIPYKNHFSKSKVIAIDISAPLLKYAFVRSNLFKSNIDFQQQNAERTSFKKKSFDLIVSHLLTHETSNKGFGNIITECKRLLKNNGIMIHVETDWNTENNVFNKLTLDWETHYNAEPFKTAHDSTNKFTLAQKCGFKPNNIYIQKIDSLNRSKYYNGKWNLFLAINKS